MEEKNGTVEMKDVFVVHTNIISALGFDSTANIVQVANSVSGVQQHGHLDSMYTSIIDTKKIDAQFERIGNIENYTRLEKIMILSLRDVIQNSNVSLSKETALIISTTKGNVDVLAESSPFSKERAYLPALGKKIQDFFGIENEAIVLSNACVSGILAVAMAKRLIQNGNYKNALIVGGDLVTDFVLSGFSSFQAISPQACKPFSKNRNGINIGEAAASVLVTSDTDLVNDSTVKILGDGCHNDANHISGPSRTGEGLYLSIQSALAEAQLDPAAIDYISAHGTATIYNDEMEAVAMNRAGLEQVSVNSLKGYYGHTLGASGLLEAVVGIHALQQNMLFASLGFDELGVSQKINVIEKTGSKELDVFMKAASGFGGCNTAVIFAKADCPNAAQSDAAQPPEAELRISGHCKISGNRISVNGILLHQTGKELSFSEFAKAAYKDNGLAYPKFFKMDKLSKLAFLGTEFLFRESGILDRVDGEKLALVFTNRASCLDTDRKYQASIGDAENYFPSPAVFVYTLPNICLGEISIRHQLKSENAFCTFDTFNPEFLENYSRALIQSQKATHVLCGWVDIDKGKYDAFLYLVSPEGAWSHTKETIDELFEA